VILKMALKAKPGCEGNVAALNSLLDKDAGVQVFVEYANVEAPADEPEVDQRFHRIMCAVSSLLKLHPSDFDALLANMLFGSADKVVIPTEVGVLEVCRQ